MAATQATIYAALYERILFLIFLYLFITFYTKVSFFSTFTQVSVSFVKTMKRR